MPLTLTSGGESRVEGAPGQPLPSYEDRVRAAAAYLVSQDRDGALYGGDPENAKGDAVQMILAEERQRWSAEDARSQASQQAAAQAGADRAKTRAARQGVVPESLPPGQFGVASGREVQEYNRPVEEAEAVLGMEQEAADAAIRGLREGQRNWRAESDYGYLQERGERNPLAAPGRRDLDLRQKIMKRRGQFYETADGTIIPGGPDPTAADLRAEAEWEDWTNETPGSERQARYAPQEYAAYQEELGRQLQESVRADRERYGEGVDDPAARVDLGLPALTDAQITNRATRARNEARLREAQRGKFFEERLRHKTGLPAQGFADPNNPTVEEMQRLAFRQGLDRRAADQERRRNLVAQRGELRGAGLSPAVGDMRNRFDDLINRLGQEGMNDWQRAGVIAGIAENAQTANPTPLGVDAMGLQNAMRLMGAQAMGGLLDPTRQAAFDLAMRGQAPEMAGQQDVAGGNWQTPEARTHLEGLAERHDTTGGGFSYEDEERLAATLQRPPYSMPQPDAEALAYELAEGRRWRSGRRPGERGQAAPPPPPEVTLPDAQQPPVRRAPQGGGRGGGTAQPPAWTDTRPAGPSRRGRRR